MREERDTALSELSNTKDELAARDKYLDHLQSQLEEKEKGLATLTAENQKLEGYLAEARPNKIFLNEKLERFKYGTSLADDEPVIEVEQQSPAVNPEPLTVKPKLLTPKELAQWINDNRNPEKSISDQNVRDWFSQKCSEKKRGEVQEKYGFKFEKRKGNTMLFRVLS